MCPGAPPHLRAVLSVPLPVRWVADVPSWNRPSCATLLSVRSPEILRLIDGQRAKVWDERSWEIPPWHSHRHAGSSRFGFRSPGSSYFLVCWSVIVEAHGARRSVFQVEPCGRPNRRPTEPEVASSPVWPGRVRNCDRPRLVPTQPIAAHPACHARLPGCSKSLWPQSPTPPAAGVHGPPPTARSSPT